MTTERIAELKQIATDIGCLRNKRSWLFECISEIERRGELARIGYLEGREHERLARFGKAEDFTWEGSDTRKLLDE